MKTISMLAISVALTLLTANESWAQISGGSIVGSVADTSGAAIPGVQVTARNVGTNEGSRTVTNETGYFEFPLLPAGRYVLEADNPGFERARTAEFSLNAGTRPRFDLKLVVGQVTESVEVLSAAPLVNATTADLGVVVDQSKVEALPLNGRDFQQLVGLQPGVYADPDSSNGARGGIEFNGASSYGNNLLMDGVDMTFGEVSASPSDKAAGSEANATVGRFAGQGIGRGSLINTISVEAIQEFKATGSAFSAEYGRATGGVINVTTKSGTNQFHGTLFEFFRNDKLDSNDFFSNKNGLAKPPLRWNQFGANLGGPIKRDKLFFFFNYEGARASQSQPQTSNVPTPLLLSMVTPAIRQNLSLLPPVTSPTSNPLVGLNYHNDNRRNNENTFVSRGDVDFGKHRLSLRYNYNHQDYQVPNIIPTSPTLFPTRFHNAEIADTESISPTMVNEWRIGFNRIDEFRHDLAFNNEPNFLTVVDSNFTTAMDFLRFDSDSYTVADNFTAVHGNHTFKAGFEIRDLRTHRFDFLHPSTTYNTVANLIADTPDTVGLTIGGQKKLRNTDYGFFFQDNWRVNKRFQVNAGLRYEYFTPFSGGWNVKNNDYFNPVWIAKKGDPMYNADRTDFSPRLGLVFDTFGDQKLIIRAGGALTYNPLQAGYLYDLNYSPDPNLPGSPSFLPSDVPPGTSLKFPFDPSFITRYIANPSLLPKDIILNRSIADTNRRDERSGTWNLSVQRAIAPNLAFQASYVGTRNWNQLGSRNVNLFDRTLGTRVHPDVGNVVLREFAGRSSYHALQIALNQRFQHGLTFDFYYTYAKAMSYYGADSGASGGDATVQDSNNIRGSYGPKVSDLRHTETLVASYALPGLLRQSKVGGAVLSGWNIQGIQSERSGLPINILAGIDEAGIKTAGFQRPDLVPGVNPYIENMNSLQWLNRAAFDNQTPAAQHRYGNLGFAALRGPSRFKFDMALHKTVKVHEEQTLTFRAEAFNILNHAIFNLPVKKLSDPNFGLITNGNPGRNIQLALKYMF